MKLVGCDRWVLLPPGDDGQRVLITCGTDSYRHEKIGSCRGEPGGVQVVGVEVVNIVGNDELATGGLRIGEDLAVFPVSIDEPSSEVRRC